MTDITKNAPARVQTFAEALEIIHRLPVDVMSAFQFMVEAHEGQKDKAGLPYWTHPFNVALRLESNDLVDWQSALGHDLLEDTVETPESLFRAGFEPEAIEVIELLEHKDEDNRPYIEKIGDLVASGNVRAMRVKRADNLDNLHPDRLSSLKPEVSNRLKAKYLRSIDLLESVISPDQSLSY